MKYKSAVHTFINLAYNSDDLVNCNGIVYLLEDHRSKFEARCNQFIKQRENTGIKAGAVHYALRLLLNGERYYITSPTGNYMAIRISECSESVADLVPKIEAKAWSCYRKLMDWDPLFADGIIKPYPQELEGCVAQINVAHKEVYITHHAFGRFCRFAPLSPELGMNGYAETRAQLLKRLCSLIRKSTLMQRKNVVNQLLRYNGEYAMYRFRSGLIMIFTWDTHLEAWVLETCYEKPSSSRQEIYKDISVSDKISSWQSPSIFA